MYLQVLRCVLGYLGTWVLGHVLEVLGYVLRYLGTWVLGYVLGVLQVVLCDEVITSKFAIFQMSHN